MNELTAKNEIVVYQPDDVMRLEVRLENKSVWLTQAQMCELFQRDVSVISRHIRNVFSEGEVDKESNLHFLQIPNSDRPIAVNSRNVIISVGYRVKSLHGTANTNRPSSYQLPTRLAKMNFARPSAIPSLRSDLKAELFGGCVHGIPRGEGKVVFAKSACRKAICGQIKLFNRSQVYSSLILQWIT